MILCNHDRQQVLYPLLTYLCSAKLNINSWIQVSHFEKAPRLDPCFYTHSSNTGITDGLDITGHLETSVEQFAAGR